MRRLLASGHRVRITCRDPGNEARLRYLRSLPGADTRLAVYKARLQRALMQSKPAVCSSMRQDAAVVCTYFTHSALAPAEPKSCFCTATTTCAALLPVVQALDRCLPVGTGGAVLYVVGALLCCLPAASCAAAHSCLPEESATPGCAVPHVVGALLCCLPTVWSQPPFDGKPFCAGWGRRTWSMQAPLMRPSRAATTSSTPPPP